MTIAMKRKCVLVAGLLALLAGVCVAQAWSLTKLPPLVFGWLPRERADGMVVNIQTALAVLLDLILIAALLAARICWRRWRPPQPPRSSGSTGFRGDLMAYWGLIALLAAFAVIMPLHSPFSIQPWQRARMMDVYCELSDEHVQYDRVPRPTPPGGTRKQFGRFELTTPDGCVMTTPEGKATIVLSRAIWPNMRHLGQADTDISVCAVVFRVTTTAELLDALLEFDKEELLTVRSRFGARGIVELSVMHGIAASLWRRAVSFDTVDGNRVFVIENKASSGKCYIDVVVTNPEQGDLGELIFRGPDVDFDQATAIAGGIVVK